MSVLIRRVFITLYGAWSSHSFARTQGASQASAQGRLQGLPAVLWPPGLLLNHQYLGNQVPKPIQDFLLPMHREGQEAALGFFDSEKHFSVSEKLVK